jgi:hypothetical protein
MTTDEIFAKLSDGKKWTETLVEMVEWAERKYSTLDDPEAAIVQDYPSFNDLANAFYASKEVPVTEAPVPEPLPDQPLPDC